MTTEKLHAHDLAKMAMFAEYKATGKTAFTKQDIHDAVFSEFGQDWNSTKVANAMSTLRYRNLMEAVGDAPKGKGGIGKLWCTIEIMEAETEPPEKVDDDGWEDCSPEWIAARPDGACVIAPRKAGKRRAGNGEGKYSHKHPSDWQPQPEPERVELPPMTLKMNSVNETYPILRTIPQQANSPEVEEIAEEWGSQFVAGGKEAALTQQAFDVTRSKRKQKRNAQQGPPQSDRQLLHELMQQVGFIARELAGQERLIRETHQLSGQAHSAARDMVGLMKAFDAEVAKKIDEFVRTTVKSDMLEVSAFKGGFVEGWNAAIKMQKTDVTLKEITGENVTMTPGEDNGGYNIVVDGGEIAEELDDQYSNILIDEMASILAILMRMRFGALSPMDIIQLGQAVKVLAAKMDVCIAEDKFVDHVEGAPKNLPIWARNVWDEFLKDLARQSKRKYVTILKGEVQSVEFHVIDGHNGRMEIRMHGGPKSFRFVVLGFLTSNMKVLPYEFSHATEEAMENGRLGISGNVVF